VPPVIPRHAVPSAWLSTLRKRPRWPRTRSCRELRANIYQARDLQAADDNGLADPYVKVSLAGASDETEVIERTLQPIWYRTVTLALELPRDLSLAPKVIVSTVVIVSTWHSSRAE